MHSPLYSQQLACLMELRQFQQQHNFVRPGSPASNVHYGPSTQSQILHERPPSKAFTIDAILGLHSAGNNSVDVRKKSNCTADIVASLAAACRRNAVHAALSSQQIQPGLECSKEAGGGKVSAPLKSQGGTKSKRVRTIFTPEQLERLEAEFERQQYMVGPERLYLASTLHLTEAQVKVWFQNRRIKWRKQHLELQQQRLAVLKQQQQHSLQLGTEEESMSGASSVSDTPD